MVPRTSFTAEKSANTARINIRDPPAYPRGCLYGTIDHEIGTHALRKYNEMSQKWYRKREKYELKYCHSTEEGFACVNQLVRTVSNYLRLNYRILCDLNLAPLEFI